MLGGNRNAANSGALVEDFAPKDNAEGSPCAMCLCEQRKGGVRGISGLQVGGWGMMPLLESKIRALSPSAELVVGKWKMEALLFTCY